LTHSAPIGRLWLIGGTQESAQLARAIAQLALPCTITVTTAAARSLYPDAPEQAVWVGCLDAHTLPQFLQEQQIIAILDASHPFAAAISQGAIAAAAQFGLPYLRYERALWEGEAVQAKDQSRCSPQTLIPDARPLASDTFPSFAALLASGHLAGHRVLLTVGYRPLSQFQPWQGRATLFARILPSVTALEAALSAGFTGDRLIAVRPPITADLERALWQQWQISLVVTKASGTPGGEDIKRQVAAELGVKLVVIARPDIVYPQQTSDRLTALEFCQLSLMRAIAVSSVEATSGQQL